MTEQLPHGRRAGAHAWHRPQVKIQSQSNAPGSAAYKGPIDAAKQVLASCLGLYCVLAKPLRSCAALGRGACCSRCPAAVSWRARLVR